MIVTNHVYPSFEQITALAQDDRPGPIIMVNLLRFTERANYPDGRKDDISGREAYMRYAVAMQPIVEGSGGRILYSGDVGALIIGETDDLWDAVAVVEYPSRADFARIAMSPEVQEIGVHRSAGLAGQLLILSTTLAIRAGR